MAGVVAAGGKPNLRAVVVAGGIAAMTVLLAPFQMTALKMQTWQWSFLPRLYHRLALRMIGVNVYRIGSPAPEQPVLFVSNHVSWLDIPVLGSILPVSFIAKREVGDWGPFGTLARLQRTIFVDRERRSDTRNQSAAIAGRLDAGDNLVLFAEGTSTDGVTVRPFKSALFAVTEAANGGSREGLMVQPVTIAYRALNGVPITRATRPAVGWYGDMALEPHLLNILGIGRIAVDVHFHKPVRAGDFPSRKALAQHCCDEVRAGLLTSRRGGTHSLRQE